MTGLALWWFTAYAGASDFEVVREGDGCVVSMRPESHPEGASMRAECTWPDVDAAALVTMLSDFSDYPRFVFPISEARVVRGDPARSLVYQRQSLFGLADREVLLWMGRAEEAGGVRFSWTAATEEPLELRPGAIRTPRNTGFWHVEPAADGGSRVVHEVALDAGGSIPRWIIELVRYRSFAKIMSDVRAAVPAR
jgi:hypothetical protein